MSIATPAGSILPNSVQLSEVRTRTMSALLRFEIRCRLILSVLQQAERTTHGKEQRAIIQLMQGFSNIVDGISKGRYNESHIEHLTNKAVAAVQSATRAIYDDGSGLMPAVLEHATGSRVLLVGEQPGVVEMRTGVPFCDTHSLLYASRCGTCRSPERCYARWFGTGNLQEPHGCPKPGDLRQQNELLQQWIEQEGRQLNNTGDLLRDLLLEAGMYRKAWHQEDAYEHLVMVSITNVFRVPHSRNGDEAAGDEQESGKRDELHGAPLWLLAVEAYLVNPRVTVLLGRRASLAAGEITGGRSGMFHSAPMKPAPPFGYTITTFHPVNLLREQNELKLQMMQHSIRNALVKAAQIARDDRYWPFQNTDDIFTISHYQESLQHYRNTSASE